MTTAQIRWRQIRRDDAQARACRACQGGHRHEKGVAQHHAIFTVRQALHDVAHGAQVRHEAAPHQAPALAFIPQARVAQHGLALCRTAKGVIWQP
ncbi:hypothetical protein D3C72_2083440 [compost metagenome]